MKTSKSNEFAQSRHRTQRVKNEQSNGSSNYSTAKTAHAPFSSNDACQHLLTPLQISRCNTTRQQNHNQLTTQVELPMTCVQSAYVLRSEPSNNTPPSFFTPKNCSTGCTRRQGMQNATTKGTMATTRMITGQQTR